MTLPPRRVLLAGAGVGVVLLVVLMTGRNDRQPGGTTPGARGGPAASAVAPPPPVTDLKLERLERADAGLDEPQRNPFRFQARQAPPPPDKPAATSPRAAAPAPPPIVAPAGPPAPPPIPLRFIGLVDAPTQAGRVAVMSDGRGNVFYGKEGDTIEGRFRMLKVSPEMVEIAYLDGRGKQTIRLSGQ